VHRDGVPHVAIGGGRGTAALPVPAGFSTKQIIVGNRFPEDSRPNNIIVSCSEGYQSQENPAVTDSAKAGLAYGTAVLRGWMVVQEEQAW
jgi:hypothetical protein